MEEHKSQLLLNEFSVHSIKLIRLRNTVVLPYYVTHHGQLINQDFMNEGLF